MLQQRSDLHGGHRPSHVRAGHQWWYTHRELRKAHGFIQWLILRDQLFTWMTAATDHGTLPKTTSPLESGINARIKELLRHHRGLSPGHAVIAIGCNTKTAHPQEV